MRLICLILIFLFPTSKALSQTQSVAGVVEPVESIQTPLMMVGEGELSGTLIRTFASLMQTESHLVIITDGQQDIDLDRWERAIQHVSILTVETKSGSLEPDELDALSNANAVWLIADVTPLVEGTVFKDKIDDLVGRGGIVGGHGRGADSMGEVVITGDGRHPGFGLMPHSVIQTTDEPVDTHAEKSADDMTDLVHWHIPPSGAMVVHQQRKIAVVGDSSITARVPAANGWPERIETFDARVVELPFTTDLISWTRSAQSRSQPVFPPKDPPAVEVVSGTLILIGGGGSTDDMWDKFIESAGGVDAKFVCLPQKPDSFSARKLRDRGCENVTVLYSDADLRSKADSDKRFLDALKDADGIFFGGGRTFRFMDAYQHTQAHHLMLEMLARGGVIAGTSAGAQIQGDFLVRGDPRTNQTLWYPGNDTGLSFLKGVIIDVHFAERGREKTLPDLLSQHPQMFGIGIDEATAIVVTGHRAEVLGRGSAWFYDTLDDAESTAYQPIVLQSGQSYDLSARQAIE